MKHRRPAPKSRVQALPRSVELEIDSIGGRGDGVARHGEDQVFVPGTVPGDKVVARIDGKRGEGLAAQLVQVLTPGPGRADPVCRHYGTCGGCSLQHVEASHYAAWKRGQLVEAMGRAGCDVSLVAPLVQVAPGSRRRAAFAFSRRRNGVTLGFNARASHQVVEVLECPLLAPALLDILPSLRALLCEVVEGGTDGDVILTATETGLDILIEAEARLDLFDREKLAAFADGHDLARLSWRRPGLGLIEPLAHRRPARITFAGVAVEPAPGGFLQPSVEGERALSSLVFDAVAGRGPVADLYAGCGSFTFPLAQKSNVHAVEGDQAAIGALKAASDRAQARVSVEVRDLARRPLLPDELKRFQAVVFDPPRAGAAAQAEQLAAGGPGLVVAVSCNPATLARDVRILCKGGYRLVRATPVDQFPWSAHLEAVAVFERG